MGGEWNFSFKHQNKDALDITKYQQSLRKLQQEFESEFSMMNPSEGSVKWTPAQESPVNNVFAKFSYHCMKPHVYKPPGHGTWTLYWNPIETIAKNDIHARCAPMFFKEISNQIQSKLVEEFPDYFTVVWKNGLSGYEGYDNEPVTNQRMYERDVNDVVRQMMVAMKWNDSDSDDGDRCIHHLPWSYCCECGDDILEMHGY